MMCPLHQEQTLDIQNNPQGKLLIHWKDQLQVKEDSTSDKDREVAAPWVWGPWLEDVEDPSQERECASQDHNKI